jgi:glycosyltransferase involved in cell wall biosynthesis
VTTGGIRHRLVLDIQTLQNPFFGERGIPRYTAELSRAVLAAGAPVAALVLNPNMAYPQRLHPELAASGKLRWNSARTFRQVAGEGPVAYHVMSPFEAPRPVQAVLPPFALDEGVAQVFTVHDMIPALFEVFAKGSDLDRMYRGRLDLIRRSDLVMTLSESTRNDALRLLDLDPAKVAMIGAGASEFFRPPLPGESPSLALAAHLPELTRPYVLAVTGIFGLDKRKNTDVLLAAYAALPDDVRRAHQLAVTCKVSDADRAYWTDLAAGLGLRPGELVLTGFVPDAVLRALYQQASLFVYPSMYEGFGLPALEAARCGCPTITSNSSSMPEILEFPPATFDPTDASALGALMETSLTDGAFGGELRAAARRASDTHTWPRVAERAIDAYRRLEPPPARRARARRLRVALVGPLPPVPSGAGDYNRAVAGALGRLCDLDVFAEPGALQPGRPGRGYRNFHGGAFGSVLSPSSYDAVVYSIGNSPQHLLSYELAIRHPGIVWFHDVSLARLHIEYALARMPWDEARDFVRSTTVHLYKERSALQVVEGDDWADYAAWEAAGIRLTAELSARSLGCIVGSEVARSIVELDLGPFTAPPPSWVVPVAPGERPPPGFDGPPAYDGPPLVVALGNAAPWTRADILLEAVAALNRLRPVRLTFVGHADPGLAESLGKRARALGLDDKVQITGRLERKDYLGWAERAVCAVQLRADGLVSGSLALADALAARLPVVTSVWAGRELPAGTVRTVAPDIGPDRLADAIASVLDDTDTQASLRAAADRYACSWTIDDVAAAVLDVARSVISPRRDR